MTRLVGRLLGVAHRFSPTRESGCGLWDEDACVAPQWKGCWSGPLRGSFRPMGRWSRRTGGREDGRTVFEAAFRWVWEKK